jgi:uncharacterized protein YkwD
MRRGGVGCALAVAAWLAMPACAQSEYETRVLAALNALRTDPGGYAASLPAYRALFMGKIVRLPGLLLQTSEGVAAVDDAIAFLARQGPVAPLAPADLLRAAAGDHAAEQAASGATGHAGPDGARAADRVQRRGGGPFVAEVIVYGPADPTDAIRQLVVDDGVPGRGHRAILLTPEMRFAGVACGPHPTFRQMCVIDLGLMDDGTHPEGLQPAR